MRNRFAPNSNVARSVDSVGWALFFMWIGVALLAGFTWTVSLVGIAAIILAVQGTLFLRGERLDVLMSAVACALLIGAVSEIYGTVWSLFPALLVIIGMLMLVDTVRRHRGRSDGIVESSPIEHG